MSCFESSFFAAMGEPQRNLAAKVLSEMGWEYSREVNGNISVIKADDICLPNLEPIFILGAGVVEYNTFYTKDGQAIYQKFADRFFPENVELSKETVIKTFKSQGFTFKRDNKFTPSVEFVDSFFMVGFSNISTELDKDRRVQINFKIKPNGDVVSDSNYIPEDLHERADLAMAELEVAFGFKREEGVHIKRKEIPAEYKNKAFCEVRKTQRISSNE